MALGEGADDLVYLFCDVIKVHTREEKQSDELELLSG